MAVESVMLSLGTTAPMFLLPDVVSGKIISLDSFQGKEPCSSCSSAGTVLM